MSGKTVDLRCKLNPTFLGLRSYFSPFGDERVVVNGSGEYSRVQNSYRLDCPYMAQGSALDQTLVLWMDQEPEGMQAEGTK